MIVVTGDQRVDVELINNVVSYLEKAKKVYSSPKKKINTLEQNELDGYRLDSHYMCKSAVEVHSLEYSSKVFKQTPSCRLIG